MGVCFRFANGLLSCYVLITAVETSLSLDPRFFRDAVNASVMTLRSSNLVYLYISDSVTFPAHTRRARGFRVHVDANTVAFG